MQGQDQPRRLYGSSQDCRQDPEADRLAPCESPTQLPPQPIPVLPPLKFLAKTVLSVSLSTGISARRVLSMFSQRDALGERL
jgi:hypothetical protein